MLFFHRIKKQMQKKHLNFKHQTNKYFPYKQNEGEWAAFILLDNTCITIFVQKRELYVTSRRH